jgi:hypothetical protein
MQAILYRRVKNKKTLLKAFGHQSSCEAMLNKENRAATSPS